jgi:hypothetical protein
MKTNIITLQEAKELHDEIKDRVSRLNDIIIYAHESGVFTTLKLTEIEHIPEGCVTVLTSKVLVDPTNLGD